MAFRSFFGRLELLSPASEGHECACLRAFALQGLGKAKFYIGAYPLALTGCEKRLKDERIRP